jgi:predicted DNA-binding WGR domain protein
MEMSTEGIRRFELVEGASSKFWEVKTDGPNVTVRYGRIGSAGTTQTRTLASAEAAAADAAQLVKEKLKKGYQELGAATANWVPPPHYGTSARVTRFLNYPVFTFNPEAEEGEDADCGLKASPSLRDLGRRIYGVHLTYDDSPEVAAQRLAALLADPKVSELSALVLGVWWGEVCEDPPTELVDLLLSHRDRLANLEGLFVGDVAQEESEISWLHQMDYGPLLNALPGLREVVIRGGEGLRLTGLAHAGIRRLTLQTGGLSGECVRDLAIAKLPALEQLALWLGSDDYGATYTTPDLLPIVDGKAFPGLEYLGLMNAGYYPPGLIEALAKSPLLGRLKGLDLSMGTFGDAEAAILLASPHLKGLKHLNLRHHFLTEPFAKRFRELGIEVNLRETQEPDEDYRFCEVAE